MGALSRMKDISDEIERLSEKPELTEDEERAFKALGDEFDELDSHRKVLERTAEKGRVASVLERDQVRNAARHGGNVVLENGVAPKDDGYDKDPILNPDSIEDCRFRNPWDLRDLRSYGRDKSAVNAELRARALSAISKMPGASDTIRKGGTSIIENWDDSDSRIAKIVLATSSPEYLRAWSKLARGKKELVTQEEQGALVRAMSLTDSAGGYMVPFQLDPTVIITSAGSLNQIRKIARQVVATGDVWNGISAGQVTWSFAAEATQASDNSPTFVQPTINTYKAQGFVPISIEALEDEANVTQEVARLLAFGKEALEAQKFISGSGSGEPFGIVTALTGTASEVTQAAGLPITSVYGLDNALPARYRSNASWLAHRAIYNTIRQFDTAGGAGMWVQLPADVPAQLVGREAYEAEAMDSTTATTKRNLIYGDFSNYVIADRVGMSIEFIPHLVGANQRPTGQRGWYAYYRVGAAVVNSDGFRMNKST
jgi:HK97 family phage major capsid protein